MMENRLDPEEWKRVFGPLTDKHFTPEEQARLRERETGDGEEGQKAWAEVIGEGKALLAEGLEPSSPEVMDLARRWMGLLDRLSGGDPAVQVKVGAMWKEAYQDEQFRQHSPVSPELMAYMGEAIRSAHAAGLIPFLQT